MTKPLDCQGGEGVKLLPCPFCGEMPKLVDVCDNHSMKHVVCSASGKCGDTGLLIALAKRDGSFEKAIFAWNTRTTPDPQILVEALEDILVHEEHGCGCNSIADKALKQWRGE